MTGTQPFTEEQLNQIRRETMHAARKALRRYRNAALAGFVILLVGIGVAIHGNAAAIDAATNRSLHARGVLCQIIQRSDQQLYRYQREGTITKAQLRRALQESVRDRQQLAPGKGCNGTLTRPR